MKKILCPVDFSETSLNALEFAVELAKSHGASITLLYIFTEKEFNQLLDADSISKEYHEKLTISEQKLESICHEIETMPEKQGLSKIDWKVKSGDLVSEITGLAREEDFDLIVMGSIGITKLDTKYIGTKALEVLEHSHCTVLCVPDDAAFHQIKTIVYASDYQEEDKLAIQQVVALGTILKAFVQIVHISHHDESIDKAMYEEFKLEMQSFTNYDKLSFHRAVYKHVAEGINDYMHTSKADLLVTLSKQRSWFQHLFFTGITKDLYHFADYPFMVIKL